MARRPYLDRRPLAVHSHGTEFDPSFSREPRVFERRLDGDGVFSSTCPDCAITVGFSDMEIDIELDEKSHRCDPAQVLQHWGPRK